MKLLALLTLTVAALAYAAPARAVTASSVAIDHRHLLGWTEGSELIVRDDRSGGRRALDLGPRCDSASISDARDGRFLIACDHLALVVDARRGPVWTGETGYSLSYTRVGRRWLEGYYSPNAHLLAIYKKWRPREFDARGWKYRDEQQPYDLDGHELRRVGPSVGQPFAVDDRWVLFPRAGSAVILHRRPFDKQLGRCVSSCDDLSIGSGLALWRHGRTLHGYVLATGTRRRWLVPEDVTVLGANDRRIYYTRRVGDLLVTARAFRWR